MKSNLMAIALVVLLTVLTIPGGAASEPAARDIQGFFGRADARGDSLRGILLRPDALLSIPSGGDQVFVAVNSRQNSLFPDQLQAVRFPRGFLMTQHTIDHGQYIGLLDYELLRWVNPELLAPLVPEQEWVIRTVLHAPAAGNLNGVLELEIGVWSGPPGQRVLRPARSFQLLLDGEPLLEWDYTTASQSGDRDIRIENAGERYRFHGLEWAGAAELQLNVTSFGGAAAARSFTLPDHDP
ncbi:hypothetical protein [Spirochaeta africana]|uniref:Uncharacterized protein n=1 Tax=Spirochaeta africana (strain ATCC 700263 / DSM 8902 / Z-7692) TaxID=889378 RepID=H9UKY2_SPIAZ|nr:hypothetical protein [Spirochaeta africana]AFG38175.1 hypothetical protein Spiaf_2127 [Spirochaeta africana DSM 8902]